MSKTDRAATALDPQEADSSIRERACDNTRDLHRADASCFTTRLGNNDCRRSPIIIRASNSGTVAKQHWQQDREHCRIHTRFLRGSLAHRHAAPPDATTSSTWSLSRRTTSVASKDRQYHRDTIAICRTDPSGSVVFDHCSSFIARPSTNLLAQNPQGYSDDDVCENELTSTRNTRTMISVLDSLIMVPEPHPFP